MEVAEILAAFTANPKLIEGVLPAVADSVVGKKLVEDRAAILYKENIGTEVQKIYSGIDDDIFAVIGRRPETGTDGKKEKTYDFLKAELTKYKKLLDIENTLNADEKIKALKLEMEKVVAEGGGKFVKEQWDAAAEAWKKEKEDLEGKITTMATSTEESIKKAEIANGLSKLQFNPDTSDTIKNMVLGNTQNDLLKNSKIEDGKVVFLNTEGKPILNSTQTEPATAAEVLAGLDGIKEITTVTKPGGGGAPPVIIGKVTTKTDDKGNAVKTLDLGPKGTFTTKVGFITAFEKGMAESGIAKGDPDYSAMEAEAYKNHDVSTLPAE